jgi:phage tail sheath protein FI
MDKNRDGNIHDAVFGPSRGVLPVEGLVVDLEDAEQELLAAAQINPVIKRPGLGLVIWGGRTLQVTESARSWLNVRERLNADEQSVLDFLENYIGKNNTAFTRFQVKSGLDNHFEPLIGDAYYDVLVTCDDTNNTSATIDIGELHVDIYVKPVRAINRILFQVVITRTDVSLTEVAAGAAA